MIARKSALVVLTNGLTGLLNYVALYVIARFYIFPKFAIGLLNFSIGFAAIFSIIANLGFPSAHIKRVSEGKDIGKCNATFFTIRLVLISLMTIATFSSIFIWRHVLHRGFQSELQEISVYIMLSYYILLALSQNFTVTYRAKKEIAISQLPMVFEATARTLATIYFVFMNYPVIYIVYTYIIGGFILFLSSYYFFKEPVEKPNKEIFLSYLKFAIPVSLASVSYIIMTNLDKVLVQLFWSYNEGADYFSIVRISRYINNITVAFGMLLLPTISYMAVMDRGKELKELSIKAERYLSMILMPIVFIMIFLAKPIIHIMLTDKFYTAIPILQILPLFALFDALERPYGTQLLGLDMPKFSRNRMLLMLSINTVLNIILIPRDIRSLNIRLAGMAGEGAAIATVVAYFAGLVYTRIVVYRLNKTGFNFAVIKHFFAAIISGMISNYIFTRIYIISRWYELVFAGIVALAIYVAILAIIREFRKEDMELFLDTANPLKMFGYIKDEINSKRTK
ncbi:MAG: polysaccharide biosynthesis C-terminal domain-containing protein [Thermoplasmata archaeon]|nr:polysaccharide biosynthesis C-terminal domain-containing protein [Thermoplasmata archaeon]